MRLREEGEKRVAARGEGMRGCQFDGCAVLDFKDNEGRI